MYIIRALAVFLLLLFSAVVTVVLNPHTDRIGRELVIYMLWFLTGIAVALTIGVN